MLIILMVRGALGNSLHLHHQRLIATIKCYLLFVLETCYNFLTIFDLCVIYAFSTF